MLKNRINKWYRGGLLGFKMQCSGRFSRRQRASSIWFLYGSVPLSTINEKIDFASYSIPILNSKITIKI
jgi:ribosomal protein S3